MNITIIGPCGCGKKGVARSDDGADLCYRHAKWMLHAGVAVNFASRKDAERAAKSLGWTDAEVRP